jgi:hypothetical protein
MARSAVAPPALLITTALAADHARRTHEAPDVRAWLDGFAAALRWAAGEGPLPAPPRTIRP